MTTTELTPNGTARWNFTEKDMETRAPMKRGQDDSKEGKAMDLPDGKTCETCAHCRRCCMMFGHIDVRRFQYASKQDEVIAHENKGGLANAIKAARGGDAPTQFKGYA